jgi:LPS O-antigen subunit length determinant protein (WzzB/FepE family)
MNTSQCRTTTDKQRGTMTASKQKRLQEICKALSAAERLGAEKDEPEGSRYVQISETLLTSLLLEIGPLAYMDKYRD